MPRRAPLPSEPVRELIEQVYTRAAAQDLTAQEVARRAGIAPETLSRMRHRGHADAGTLDALGRQVGLRLAFVEDNLAGDIEAGTFFDG